jgi:ankyrin repeat protein
MTTSIVRTSVMTAAVLSLMTMAQGAMMAAADDLRLLEAMQRQDREAVRTLLTEGVDVNAARGDGATALAFATHLDDLEAVDLLIHAGADVNAANDLAITPLMLAATNGSAAMVERLLNANADPNAARPTGETALVMAARTGRPDVVRLLLAVGAAADFKIGAREQTPLMWAAAEGHAPIVRLLLEVGADKEARTTSSSKTGRPRYASQKEPLAPRADGRSVIAALWPRDGNSDTGRSEGGMTPLLFAVNGGHQDAVRVLLEAGAKVDGALPDGLTPLQLAQIRRHEVLALFLLEHGADPDIAGPGFPPLHVAAYLSQPAIAKALIARGADVNARMMTPHRLIEALELGSNRRPGDTGVFTNIGSTPFVTAAKHGQIEIMRTLLDAGADPFLTAEAGENALMSAAGIGRPQPSMVTYHAWKEADQFEAVRIGLELGLDINAKNEWGLTALHGAAYMDDASVIELLAAHGASLNTLDWQNQTPLRVAQGHEICCSTYHRKPLAAAALLKAGANAAAGVLLKFAAHDFQDDAVKATFAMPESDSPGGSVSGGKQ